ncbi:MAG: tubulin-like doman-containing protein [Clostridia bacterium]|nr:tubulin-like doman-containing protein [Clostridia bacterium]
MAKNELLQPNKVNATLFVGVGGIGSRIIKGVAERCINDDTSNIRFVSMDTDVNDLRKLEDGPVITAIQTSSTRSIKDYLNFDADAKENWFPENRILDYKTVSEGAGQVRAISRLALNATIRQGNINKLYEAIDALFLKDGSDKNQAIKVVIASSLTGGTGSGIALPIGMMIRNYLSMNYPESAAIIRGFFIMPGVMDTVITTESERLSQRRNGYAALKEINAFMMKGSGFFDSEPVLKRYQAMGITVPTTAGEDAVLDCLPFDFCFLLDRIDEKQRSMQKLPQYEAFAAQAIYEQNIGPMNASASSKEDNIVKEFIDPIKLGRCRFGGAGASVLKYPYADIRDYIALNWTQRAILGAMPENASEDVRAKIIKNSWLRYDAEFADAVKKYERNPQATASDEPILAEVYMDAIENVGESGDDFTNMIRDKFLEAKANDLDEDNLGASTFGKKMQKVATKFIDTIVTEVVENHIEKMQEGGGGSEEESSDMGDLRRAAEVHAEDEGFSARYRTIETLSTINDNPELESTVRKFVRGALGNDVSIKRDKKDAYTLEAYLTSVNKVMHPNAARYLLYKLQKALKEEANKTTYDKGNYEKQIAAITRGVREGEDKPDIKQFQVRMNFGKETTLRAMCDAIDDANRVAETLEKITGDKKDACNDMLDEYYNVVVSFYKKVARKVVCVQAQTYVDRLIKAYERFFGSFETKVVSIEKNKKAINDKLAFNNGDCVMNLFAKKELLDMLVDQQGAPMGNNNNDRDLYASIYDAVKENASIEERTTYNPLLQETKHDIFDEIIVEHYKKMVENNCDEIIDRDILQGIRLEYDIKTAIDKSKAQDEEARDRIMKRASDPQQIKQYVKKKIESCRNLASPGISKKDFEESRDVNAIAFGEGIKDGNGIRVGEYLNEKDRSASVSKYELHFFSSVYNIMPTQLSKLHYEVAPDIIAPFETHREGAGDYFLAYQDYMEKIGPDSKLNAVITPHIDKRFNSISVMPEIDLVFQEDLTKHIHQALFYGLVFDIIRRHVPSKYAPDEYEYIYKDGRNGFKTFIVSNGTACDEFYEILDALYFDRAAVTSVHNTVDEIRQKDIDGSKSYESTTFAKRATSMVRGDFIDLTEADAKEKAYLEKSDVSVFEIPLIYYNSIPAQKKDIDEIESMVDAIIEAINREISSSCRKRDIKPLLAQLTVKHFTLLKENYEAAPEFFGKGVDMMSNDVMQAICKKIEEKFEDLAIQVPDELRLG